MSAHTGVAAHASLEPSIRSLFSSGLFVALCKDSFPSLSFGRDNLKPWGVTKGGFVSPRSPFSGGSQPLDTVAARDAR